MTMTKTMLSQFKLLMILLCTVFSISKSYASDLRWDKVYQVPNDEIWQISWKNPYESGEVRPLYDVRIQTGNFDNLNENTTLQNRNRRGQTTSVLAMSKSDPAIVMLYGGARFDIANDLLSLSITRYMDADIGN